MGINASLIAQKVKWRPELDATPSAKHGILSSERKD
jgi:hypothetical protein